MARLFKYPDLQNIFNRAVVALLKRQDKVRAREVVEFIEANPAKYAVSQRQMADLKNNTANYITRALKAKIVASAGGPWGGYKLPRQR